MSKKFTIQSKKAVSTTIKPPTAKEKKKDLKEEKGEDSNGSN